MKSSSLFVVAFTFVLMNNMIYANTQEVDIALEDVHVPLGFDSNDKNIQFAVTGIVPDTCYLRPQGVAKIEGNQITVDMKAVKVANKDVVCIQAVVPYLVTVNLGQLREGHYEITVNKGKSSEKDSVLLVEKPSSNSIDNFTYANVSTVDMVPSKDTLILKGSHPSGCMNIDRIEVVPNLNGNTYAILPIVRQEAPICDRMMKPFAFEVPIPPAVDDQSVVFHVRKIAGNAINVRWQK